MQATTGLHNVNECLYSGELIETYALLFFIQLKYMHTSHNIICNLSHNQPDYITHVYATILMIVYRCA